MKTMKPCVILVSIWVVQKSSPLSKYYYFCWLIYAYLLQFLFRYGKGFGFIGKLLGEKSPLNVPNSLVGIMAYSLLATLGMSIITDLIDVLFHFM